MKGLFGFLLFAALIAHGLTARSVMTALVCIVLAIVVFVVWPVDMGRARS